MVDSADPPSIEQLQHEVAALRKQVAELNALRKQAGKATRALRRSKQRYRTLVDNVNDLIYTVDLDGRFTYVSPALKRVSKYDPAEVIGRPALDFVHPDDRPLAERAVAAALCGDSTPYEFRVIDKDGVVHYVRASSSLLQKREQAVGLVGIMTDVTSYHEMQRTRREHDVQVRLIMESIPVPIVITRLSDTAILAANARASDLFGWPHEQLPGRHARDFFFSQREFRQLVVRVRRDGVVRDCQVRGVKADGTVFWLAASIERITFRGEDALVSGFFDLTERMQAEEALRQYATELQTRNDELDAFAHTVAHDLKSPLSLIIGYADILIEMEAASLVGASRQPYLQIIGQTADKINNIVEELMLLSEVRKGRVDLQPLDMHRIALESRARLNYLIIVQQAEVVLPGDWPIAVGYGPWVEEVWINYLSNAIKYGGRPPRVELGADDDPIDGQVRFWVRDNGQGLTAEQQSQLFTPFTQLAPARATGHGLGLSIVRRIVEKLGGAVGVESTIGQGSTFFFTLPAVSISDPD